jgi:hypothetical protein
MSIGRRIRLLRWIRRTFGDRALIATSGNTCAVWMRRAAWEA